MSRRRRKGAGREGDGSQQSARHGTAMEENKEDNVQTRLVVLWVDCLPVLLMLARWRPPAKVGCGRE